jgi:hypothetical protein
MGDLSKHFFIKPISKKKGALLSATRTAATLTT